MTFLKKLGVILAKGTQILTGVGPFVPQYENQVTKVKDIVTEILDVVVTVEAISAAMSSPLSGPDKLKAATPLITQLILKSDQFTGKNVSNPALFQEGIVKITNGFVDVLNSIDPTEVK